MAKQWPQRGPRRSGARPACPVAVSVGQPERKLVHVDHLQAEIRRLTAENAKLLEQREVLKKSLGILSETPPSGMPKLKP